MLAYLLAAGGEFLNEDERELLLYVWVVVWQMMLQGAACCLKLPKKLWMRQKEKT